MHPATMLGQQLPAPGQAPSGQATRLCHLLSDESLLRRLSGNTGEDCISALRSLNLPDSFWTDEFKVVPCSKTYAHKWTLCPCAHIGETARRRCPRSVNYKAVLCPLVKAKKVCPLGDACSYAHNVFEHWLHPSRYKTRLCSFGRNCNRSICFFAHSAEELRCVPCTDDKESDDREYLMQLLVAQENGLLPPSSPLDSMQPSPMPPLLSTMIPELSSALQQALQQPLPASARSSLNGMPDAATALMSARQSLNGVPPVSDLMSARPSLSGLPADAGGAMLRASLPGIADVQTHTPAGMLLRNRPSMNGLPDRTTTTFAPTRLSMNGLPVGSLPDGAFARTRPSLSGLPEATASASAATNMLLSMQRAVSSELNSALSAASVQRAMSNELGVLSGGAPNMGVGMGMVAPFHASAMQHALSGESPSGPYTTAAAAMERAFSRELSCGTIGSGSTGIGPISPVQPAAADMVTAATLERMYPGMQPQSQHQLLVRGGSRREMSSMAPTQSMNSVESDSLIQLRGSVVGAVGVVGGAAVGSTLGTAGAGAIGYEAGLGGPQAPARLSDPGSNNFHMAMTNGMVSTAASHARVSDSGNKLGMMNGKDFQGLESLLPLVSGVLALPVQAHGAARDMRRSNSGSNNSGRVLSPPLQDPNNAGSPSHSGSLTPLSSNSVGEVGSMDGRVANITASAAAAATAGSPSRAVETTAAFEGMYLAAAAASGGGIHSSHVANLAMMQQVGGGAVAAVDQSYLTDLVARLQDQGVNKDQLVSSLSQLLAQLLSVQ